MTTPLDLSGLVSSLRRSFDSLDAATAKVRDDPDGAINDLAAARLLLAGALLTLTTGPDLSSHADHVNGASAGRPVG